MIKKKVNKHNNTAAIILNKQARHEYVIDQEIEAGIVLQGWEVKSLRANKVTINNSYIMLKNGEAYLFGSNFQPLLVTSSHVNCEPIRNRKLLLHQFELDSLYGYVNRKNYTIVALALYWKDAWAKLKIGTARGKKEHDKRTSIKEREWKIYKARITKNSSY